MKRDKSLTYPTWMRLRFPVVVIDPGHHCYRQHNDDPPAQHNKRAVH